MRFPKIGRTRDGQGADVATPSIDVKDDLDKVWATAIEEFQRITNVTLPIGESAKFVEIRDQMHNAINQGQSKNKALAKQVLDKSMALLQNFGDIFASATSAVFPATGQCWNAISMVVGAAQSYHRILDGFVTLLERCLAFLEELFFFLDKKKKDGETYLDVHIRKPAYEILGLFLQVLASSYKLSRSKCEKLKMFLEVFLFNDDAGVAAYLSQFEEKVRQLTNRKVDVILQDVKGLAKYMVASDGERDRHFKEINDSLYRTVEAVGRIEATTQDIKSSQDREFSKQEKKAKLELIRDKLNIGPDQKPWKEQQQKIGLNRVPNTGIWLLRGNIVFRRWANVREKAVAAIILTGKSGYGKSFLCSHVISYLLDTYSQSDQLDRVFVAYYFRGNDRQMSLGACLRSLIYQLASDDPEFCEEMAKVLEKQSEFTQVKDLWNLVVSGPLKVLHGRTYYLCIDGYRSSKEDDRDDQALAEIVRSAMLQEHNVALRLFISTELEDIAKIPFDGRSRPPDITLGLPRKLARSYTYSGAFGIHADGTLSDGRLPNQDDLIRVARFRIDAMCRAKPDLRSLLDGMEFDVPERLAIAARGYYANLDSKLRQINAGESEERVKDIIDRADDDMDTTVKESIIALNASLTDKDIEHLNEMLAWIMGCHFPIHVDLLQAALYLAVDKNFMLRTLIDLKYSTLLKLDENDFVVLQSDDLKHILQASGTSRSETDSSQTKSLLHPSEVDLVDRFLKNICGDDLYARFDFSDFFNVKRGKGGNRETSIGVGSRNSLNIRILHRCLTALSTRKDDDRLEQLREYAASQWFKHMEEVDDFSEADEGLLRDIKRGIVAVLSDPKSIEIWWDPIRWDSQREICYEGSQFIDISKSILRTEDVALSYSEPADTEWVRSVTAEDGTGQHILYHLAMHMARKWFSLGYHLDELFSPDLFHLPYMMMKSGFKYDPSRGEVDNLKTFISWVREHVGAEIDEAHWKYAEGTAFQPFLSPDDVDEILEASLDAFRAAEDSVFDLRDLWPIPGYVGEAQFDKEQYAEALKSNLRCRELKSGVVGTGRSPLEEKNYLEEYVHSYLIDAACYERLDDSEAAATSYQEVMKHDIFWYGPRDQDMHEIAAESLFTLWNDNDNHTSILEMMQVWRQAEDGTHDIKYWLRKMGRNQDFHSHICFATIKMGRHQEVIEMYQYVLEQASDVTESDDFDELYHYYASILYYASSNDEDHDVAIEYWRDLLSTFRIQVGSIGSIDFDAFPAIVQRSLCKALIDKAVSQAAENSPEEADKYTSQLRALATKDDLNLPQLRNTEQDPRIALARLLIMQSKTEEAHYVAETIFRSIFEKWPDSEDEAAEGYVTLGCLLSVLDDNDSAVAAWNTGYEPIACQSCYDSWPDVTVFHCKQCLSLWLCADCHSDLLSDDLAPEICNKDHSFLEIPVYESSEQEGIGEDMVKVGDSVMRRKDWIDGLRARWNVTEEQLARRKADEEAEARASEVIGRRVNKWWKETRKQNSTV
ncbi:hypothetical protein F5Y04DRAFT_76061 [Hypomontagnella monticulosa]|nr:hypothetical protein F5Y04DRAFT_76061 [Hypomontagnella monticulosa]